MADQIQPPLFPQVFEKTIDDKEILIIQVFPGGQKPYYISSEGMERGVYIRVGSHTRRAEGELLEELRLQRHGLSYDEALVLTCSPPEELDLKILPSSLRTQKALMSLGLIRNDPFTGDIYPTRGGVLMLYKNPEKYVSEAYTIVSRMRGNSGRNTIESIDVKGYLSQQSDSIYDIVLNWLSENPRVVKTRYIGQKTTLPMEVFREAVNNALFHRKYSIAGPIKIAMYLDRLEIFSPGHFAGPFIPSSLGDGFTKKALISSADVCEVLSVSKATAVGYLNKLQLKGLIQTVGKGPKTRYKVKSV